MRSDPKRIFYNIFRTGKSFLLDINSVYIKTFQSLQGDNEPPQIKEWLRESNPQDFYSSRAENLFKILINVLTGFSFLGIFIAIKERDTALLVPIFVYLFFCMAHCITYLDLTYYYIKMPYLFILSAYFVNRIMEYVLVNRRVSVDRVINILLIIIVIVLDVIVFLS